MKKLCVIFSAITVLSIVGMSAWGPEAQANQECGGVSFPEKSTEAAKATCAQTGAICKRSGRKFQVVVSGCKGLYMHGRLVSVGAVGEKKKKTAASAPKASSTKTSRKDRRLARKGRGKQVTEAAPERAEIKPMERIEIKQIEVKQIEVERAPLPEPKLATIPIPTQTQTVSKTSVPQTPTKTATQTSVRSGTGTATPVKSGTTTTAPAKSGSTAQTNQTPPHSFTQGKVPSGNFGPGSRTPAATAVSTSGTTATSAASNEAAQKQALARLIARSGCHGNADGIKNFDRGYLVSWYHGGVKPGSATFMHQGKKHWTKGGRAVQAGQAAPAPGSCPVK